MPLKDWISRALRKRSRCEPNAANKRGAITGPAPGNELKMKKSGCAAAAPPRSARPDPQCLPPGHARLERSLSRPHFWLQSPPDREWPERLGKLLPFGARSVLDP